MLCFLLNKLDIVIFQSLNISHKAAIQKNRPLPATHSSELKGRSFCNKNLPAAKVQTQHKLTVDNFIEKILKWTPKWLQEQGGCKNQCEIIIILPTLTLGIFFLMIILLKLGP